MVDRFVGVHSDFVEHGHVVGGEIACGPLVAQAPGSGAPVGGPLIPCPSHHVHKALRHRRQHPRVRAPGFAMRDRGWFPLSSLSFCFAQIGPVPLVALIRLDAAGSAAVN